MSRKRTPKILFINPNLMQPPVPPLALDYLGAALATQGVEAHLLDLAWVENLPEAIERACRQEDYTAVGISIRNLDDCYFATQEFTLPWIRRLTEWVRFSTEAPVILGGVGYSVAPQEILHYCIADYGLIGEGEASLAQLLFHIEKGQDPRNIPGLVWAESGLIDSNPPSPLNLDKWDLSPRSLVDNRRYFLAGGQAGFETKRGCAHQCLYCVEPQTQGNKIRLRSPSGVMQEIENLLRMGIDTFHVCDSEFNLPLHHAKEICRALAERGLGERIRWYTYAAPLPFDKELARLMRASGCAGIIFGADHGEASMLRNLGRAHSPPDIEVAARLCKEHGIDPMFDLILGGPGETPQTMTAALELMKKIQPARVGISYGIRIYQGTPMARRIMQEGFDASNPALHGRVEDNRGFLYPVFYISPALGLEGVELLQELTAKETFFSDAKIAHRKRDSDTPRIKVA